MAKINMVIPHQISQEDALRRIQALLGEVRDQFSEKIGNLHEEWTGNMGEFSFEAMGYPVAGTLNVGVFDIKLSSEIPFAVSLFKGKIETIIKERAKTLLA